MDKIYTFEIKSMFAHFRKFETNSSSLSYFFPPPTSLQGLVAGLFGLNKDSYYQLLSSESLDISVAVSTPLRKLTPTVNYPFFKKGENFTSVKKLPIVFQKHTQIPIEFVISKEFPKTPLSYRVFFRPKSKELIEKFDRLFSSQAPHFTPLLGSAFCPAWIEHWEVVDNPEFFVPSEAIPLHTVIPNYYLEGGELLFPENDKVSILKDRMVRSFRKDRMRTGLITFIWEKSGKPLLLRTSKEIFQCTLASGETWRGVLF